MPSSTPIPCRVLVLRRHPGILSLGPWRTWPGRWVVVMLALVAWASAPAAASAPATEVATTHQIDLTGSWRMKVGDGVDWATSQLDDTWETVTLPASWKEQGLTGVDGPVWFRRAISLKEPLATGSTEGWGLMVGPTRFGSLEAWINGVPLSSGSGRQPPVPVPRLRVLAAPGTVIEGHTQLAIAIRVSRPAWAADRAPNGGPVGHELVLAPFRDLVDRVELDRHRDLIASLPLLVVSIVLFCAALGFILLWVRWRFGIEHLWFGLVALGYSLNTLLNSQWIFEVTDRFALVIRLDETLASLLAAVFIEFLWTYLDRSKPAILRAYQGSFVAIAVAIAGSPTLGWVVDSQSLRWLWLVPLLVFGLHAVVAEVRRGNRAARSVALAGTLLVGTELLAIVGSLRNTPLPLALQPAWAFGLFVLAMAVVLFDRLNRMRVELDDRVASLARAREALRETESRLRLVLDNTSELLVLWTVEEPVGFRVAAANRAFTEFLQRENAAFDPKDLIGMSLENVGGSIPGLSDESLERSRSCFQEAMATRRPVTWQMDIDAPMGRLCFETSVFPVLDERGVCTHLLRTWRDVTLRVRVAEELCASEERFAQAFRSSPVPMTISRLSDGHVIDSNDSFEAMVGPRPPGPYDGAPFDLGLLTDPRDQDRLAAGLAHDRSVRDQEIRIRTRDGRAIAARYSAEVVEIGGQSCLLSVFLETTEQRRAHTTVRLLAHAVRSINEFVSITGPDNRIVYVNEAFLRAYGYDERELLGKPIDIVRAAAQTSPTPKEIGLATTSGGWQGELLNRRKDGTEFPVFLSSSVVLDDNGAPLGLIGVATDISDRRREEAQRARLQAEITAAAEEWTATFDAVRSALVLTDWRGTVRRVNNAALELAGREFEDVAGHPLANLGTGEPWLTGEMLVRKATAEGMAAVEEVRSPAGRTRWVVEAVSLGSNRDRAVLSIRDITAVMELQETQQRKQSMTIMGSLVGGVAHEVRNPLFGISGVLDALDARFGGDERLGEFLEAMRREIDRLSALMHTLLEFGRPLGDKLISLPLSLVAREAAQLCLQDASNHGVHVKVEVPDSLPPVPMDHLRMTGALRNLVENAIQHSPRSGVVAVTARMLGAKRPDWLELTVRDSGPGFAEIDRVRVFEPFFTRRPGATGLGLSIVHRVVGSHGGEVEVGNHPEGGGVVTIRLPVEVEGRESAR